ncbi:MAG: phosphotransferase [Pseudomonadota bacterium]
MTAEGHAISAGAVTTGVPRPEIAAFLAAAGHAAAALSPLAGDASARRYFRVEDRGARMVLMDAPRPANESMAFFVTVTDWLRARGLSAPEVLAADLEAGFVLLEDLGDALFARVLSTARGGGGAGMEEILYAAAVDLLAALPEGEAPVGTEPYGDTVLLREARLAPDWWAAGLGVGFGADALAEYDALLQAALAPALVAGNAQGRVTVLRDYHAENLLWLPERAGAARVGLLDYQDALLGHPAYDLVSLLEDARRDTSAALREAMLARYLERRGLSGADAAAFRAAYAALGAQRNLKIVGIFARLCLRDAKPRYLTLIPRVWAHLERDLAAPGLAPLRRFVVERLPAPEAAALERLAARAGCGMADGDVAGAGSAPL